MAWVNDDNRFGAFTYGRKRKRRKQKQPPPKPISISKQKQPPPKPMSISKQKQQKSKPILSTPSSTVSVSVSSGYQKYLTSSGFSIIDQ